MPLRLPLPPSYDDRWRLLTQKNITVRSLWPWSFSIQKFIDVGEPRPRQSPKLLVASDFGGEHPRATHHVYCYLVIRGGAEQWLSSMRVVRRNALPQGRIMCYKGLNDAYRQQALVSYLQAAANLDGHLVAIVVDKRKRWLSTAEGHANDIREAYGLSAKWNPRSLEQMMRKVQFNAILLSIWAQPYTNVTWITDEDEFVANDMRHDDALVAAGRMSSFYVDHPMGVFRLNTTGQDPEVTDFEDICSIPDLAAGMLSEVSTRLRKDVLWEDGFRRALWSPLPLKTEIIADWFWDNRMRLRKTMIAIDLQGPQYEVRKLWMQQGGEMVPPNEGPSNSAAEH